MKLALTIVVVLAVAVAIALVATWQFARSMAADLQRLEAGAASPGITITAQMLAGLPAPARRYFERAGVVGKLIPRVARLAQSGRIRSSADAGWMNLDAQETYSTQPPAFVWRAWFPRSMLPVVMGRDEYLDGRGSIVMKALGLATVAEERGDALGAAGLMRYLNEAAWFPAAYLGANVTIAPVDDSSFAVTIADRGVSATGTLFVDGEGRLTNFRALRFNTATRTMETWETPMTAWGERAGLELPIAGSAVWKLKAGDLTYIEVAVGDVAYER